MYARRPSQAHGGWTRLLGCDWGAGCCRRLVHCRALPSYSASAGWSSKSGATTACAFADVQTRLPSLFPRRKLIQHTRSQLGNRYTRPSSHRVRLPCPLPLLLDLQPSTLNADRLLGPRHRLPLDRRQTGHVLASDSTGWFRSRPCQYWRGGNFGQLDDERKLQGRVRAGGRGAIEGAAGRHTTDGQWSYQSSSRGAGVVVSRAGVREVSAEPS